MSVAAARALRDVHRLLRRHRPAEHGRQPRPPHARARPRARLRGGRDRRQADRGCRCRSATACSAETADAVVSRARDLQLLGAARPHRRRLPRRRPDRPLRQHQHDRDRRRLRPSEGPPARRGRRARDRRLVRRGDRDRAPEHARVRGEGRLHHLGRPRRRARATASGSACAASGPTQVITDLGILEPDPETCELALTARAPRRRPPSRRARRPAGTCRSPTTCRRPTRRPTRSSTPCASSEVRAPHERRVRPRRGPHAVRPLRRRAGRRAPRRPRRATWCRPLLDAQRPRPRARSTTSCFGNANGAGEDNRNVARMAVLLAGLPTSVPGVDRQPPVRLEPRRGDAGAAARSRPATPTLVLVGGVESMSRAPWVLLKPEKGVPGRPRDAALDHARLAHGQPGDARAVDDLARREHREARRASTSIGREAQDEFALRSHQRAATAWDDGFYDDWVVPVPGTELDARRGHPRRTRRWRSWPSSSRRSARTARSPPATRRRSTTARPRVLIGDEAARRRPARAARADRRPRRVRRRPRHLRHRPGRGRRTARWSAPASAGATSTSSSSTRRSPRSRSRACASGRSSTPSSVNVQRRRDRASGTRSARRACRILGTLAHALRRRGGGCGVAAICIGVGQGLAVVLEA